MDEAYLHFPTALDWIEHGLAFIGAGAVGWWLRPRAAKFYAKLHGSWVQIGTREVPFND